MFEENNEIVEGEDGKKTLKYPIKQEPPFPQEESLFGMSPVSVYLHEDSIQYIFRFVSTQGVSVITYTNTESNGKYDLMRVSVKAGKPKGLPLDDPDWYEKTDLDIFEIKNELVEAETHAKTVFERKKAERAKKKVHQAASEGPGAE